MPGRAKPWTSKKWMHRMYVIKRMTEQEIADLAQTNQSTINRWLKKHELLKK